MAATRFAFDDQIQSQAGAVAAALRVSGVPSLDPERPLLFSGIGTSLHACQVAAYWVAELSDGALRPAAVEAHELALHGGIHAHDQVVVVSHRGTKRFPNQLLARASSVGATTVMVTGLGAPSPTADFVLRTCPDERASTHTVSYLTALAVLGRLVATTLDAGDFADRLGLVPEAIAETLALPDPIRIPPRLINREPIVVTGYGIDAITADEAALKIKEGAYLFAEGMSQELALHGTPAVFESRMAAIMLQPGRDDGGREPELRSLLRELGVLVLSSGPGETDLPFARTDYLLRPLVAIIPIQRLVAELGRGRGSNPDLTRGDVEPWASAIPKVHL